MTGKKLLLSGITALTLSFSNSQESYLILTPTDYNNYLAVSDTVDYFISSYPNVESILHNPAVQKKQLSRNMIQAIGHKEGRKKHFIVHFRKKQLHGQWQSFYNNNQLCDSGWLERNIPDGEWKTWYPNGQLKTVRNYSAEKYHYIKADLQRNHPKQQRYSITRYANRHENIERHFQPNYESSSANAETLSLLHKIQRNTEGNGHSYMAPFKNCLHHGLYINYYANGSVKDSGHYVNGLKQGLWEETVNEGSIRAFGFYENGLRNGQWKYYDSNNQLVYTEHYNRNGKISKWHHFKK